MKILICKKCGETVSHISTAKHGETGEEIKVEVQRLPFGLCSDCFVKEFKDDPDFDKKLREEVKAIEMEGLAIALAKKAEVEGTQVFDYQCPACGAKAKGVGTKEEYENAMKLQPLCPDCEQERRQRETAGEDQSFAA